MIFWRMTAYYNSYLMNTPQLRKCRVENWNEILKLEKAVGSESVSMSSLSMSSVENGEICPYVSDEGCAGALIRECGIVIKQKKWKKLNLNTVLDLKMQLSF